MDQQNVIAKDQRLIHQSSIYLTGHIVQQKPRKGIPLLGLSLQECIPLRLGFICLFASGDFSWRAASSRACLKWVTFPDSHGKGFDTSTSSPSMQLSSLDMKSIVIFLHISFSPSSLYEPASNIFLRSWNFCSSKTYKHKRLMKYMPETQTQYYACQDLIRQPVLTRTSLSWSCFFYQMYLFFWKKDLCCEIDKTDMQHLYQITTTNNQWYFA